MLISHYTYNKVSKSPFEGKVRSIDVLENGKGRISSDKSTLLLSSSTIKNLIGCDPSRNSMKAVAALNIIANVIGDNNEKS